VDRLGRVRLLEARLAVEPEYTDSSVLFPCPSSSPITILVVLYDSYDSEVLENFSAHHPYIYLPFSAPKSVLYTQYDALDHDLQPKKLGSNITKHKESSVLSHYSKCKAKHQEFMCKTPYSCSIKKEG
jgi:hypothetical protein